MENNKDETTELKGTELTHEQFSDVYTAGTSDGIHQLEGKRVKVEREGYKFKQKQ